MLKWGLAIFLVETTSKRIYKHNTEMGHFKLFSAKIEDHHSIMSLVGSTAFIRIVLDKCSNFWWSAILHIEKTTNYGEISLTPLYMGWCDPRAAASSVRTLYKRCYGCPVSLQPLSQHVALEPVWEPSHRSITDDKYAPPHSQSSCQTRAKTRIHAWHSGAVITAAPLPQSTKNLIH